MKLHGNRLLEAYYAPVGSFLDVSDWSRNIRRCVTLHLTLVLHFSCHLGGNGYINDYPTGRFLRDAKLYEIGAGTSEIRRWLIGEKLNSEFL